MKKLLLFLLFTIHSFGFAQNVGDYRSVTNGIWDSNTTWQVWTVSGWATPAAGNYPGKPAGKYAVTISSGTAVQVLNPAISAGIGNLYIGGTLELIGSLTVTSTADPIPNLYITNGLVLFHKNQQLVVPGGASVQINITDSSTQGLQAVSPEDCKGSAGLKIGNKYYSACTGNAGTAGTFEEVNQTSANPVGIAVANADPEVVCIGKSVQLLGSKIGNAPVTNVQWTRLSTPSSTVPQNLGNNGSTIPFNISSGVLSEVGDYVFKFSFSVGANTFSDQVTVSVKPNMTAGTPSANPVICIGSALSSNITIATTGAAGIGSPTELPAGVTASWASGVITIKGTPTVSGIFNYRIPLTGGCGTVTATGTITVSAALSYGNLNGPDQVTICQGGSMTATGQVYGLGVTEAAGQGAEIAEFGYSTADTDPSGGGWTWVPATFNLQNGNNDEFKHLFTPASAGTYYYTFRYKNGSCGYYYGGYSATGGGFWNGVRGTGTNVSGILRVNSTAAQTVTLSSASSTTGQSVCIGSPITAITYALGGGAASATIGGLPAGVTGSLTGKVFTISGIPAESGTFNYTVTTSGNGCSAEATATGTITVSQAIGFANLQWLDPGGVNQTICLGTSRTAYGQVYIAGMTDNNTSPRNEIAEFGYSTASSDPTMGTGWTWVSAGAPTGTRSGTFGNNDEFSYIFTPPAAGTYYYTFRYKNGSCNSWYYGGYNSEGGGQWNGTTNVTGVLTVKALPVATVAVSGSNQICSNSTAVFTITGSPGDLVTYNLNGVPNTITFPPTGSYDVSAPAAMVTQTLSIVSVNNGSCSNSVSSTATITVGGTSIYTATGWSNGLPDNNGLNVVIAADYDTAAGSIAACNCTVNSGITLTVSGDTFLEVLNNIINNGRLIVESDGNLKQINAVTNTTPITVRRLHTLTELRKEYNFLSSPVAGQNMKAIYGDNAANVPFVTVLRESTNSFVNATANDYTIPGKGFSVREPRTGYVDLSGDDLSVNEAQFKGKPNNGDIVLIFPTFTPGRGYNLAGNPYPSNVDINAVYNDPQTMNIHPEFRFWDNTVNATYVQMGGAYQGYSYAIFNAETEPGVGYGIAAPGNDKGGPEGEKIPASIIKVSQGLMVRANAAGAQLSFRNSMRRTTNAGTVFFGKDSPRNRYRLQLVKADGFTIQNAIAYFDSGKTEFGIEDTRIPNSSASDALFTYAEDAKVVINGRNGFIAEDVLALGTRHYTSGTYILQAVDEEGVFAKGQAIYLKDKALGIITDLTKGDYSFTSEAGEYTNRFEIVYTTALVLATDAAVKNNVEVYRDAADFVLRSSEKAIEYVEVYDASGRLVLQAPGQNRELRFSADRLESGIYVVKAQLKGGEQLTKKIRK